MAGITEAQFAALQRPRPGTRKSAPKAKGKLEREVVEQVCGFLATRGYEAIRQHAGVAKGLRGGFITMGPKFRPDMYFAHPERVGFYAEFKREKGGILSDGQIACHAQLRAKGFKVAVPRSLDEFADWYGQEIEPKVQFSISRKR